MGKGEQCWKHRLRTHVCMSLPEANCAQFPPTPHLLPGTPTPSTQASDIGHFQPLLSFLHHCPYGKHPSLTWDPAVREGGTGIYQEEAALPEPRARPEPGLESSYFGPTIHSIVCCPHNRGSPLSDPTTHPNVKFPHTSLPLSGVLLGPAPF